MQKAQACFDAPPRGCLQSPARKQALTLNVSMLQALFGVSVPLAIPA